MKCRLEENLRSVLIADKVPLYSGFAKVTNCGGVGQCGTCIVKITEGLENLSARSVVADQTFKGKPAEARLACQCLVTGDVSLVANG